MKVNGANQIPYVNQVYQRNSKNTIDKKENTGIPKDRIELSKTSQEVKKYIDKIDHIEIGNQEKVARIKKAIENGTYRVSSKEIAEVILDRISQEKGKVEE